MTDWRDIPSHSPKHPKQPKRPPLGSGSLTPPPKTAWVGLHVSYLTPVPYLDLCRALEHPTYFYLSLLLMMVANPKRMGHPFPLLPYLILPTPLSPRYCHNAEKTAARPLHCPLRILHRTKCLPTTVRKRP